jgi:hypothetical protein
MPLMSFSQVGTGGGSVPFQRTVDPSKLGVYIDLDQAESLRIQRYDESFRFYLGNQWSYSREDGEPLVTVNYIRKFVDKSANFLIGKGFSLKVPDSLAYVTLPALKEVWKYNREALLAREIALMGGITGDAFVLVTYQEPTAIQRRVNPYSKGQIRLNLVPSGNCFPTWDPLNQDVLLSVRIEHVFYSERGVTNDTRNPQHGGKTLYTKRFTQLITSTEFVESIDGQELRRYPNLLGEIPLVHIQNIIVPKEYYGLADTHDLIALQREYNEKCTDISDIINYQAAPVVVITGARAKNLERGPKQIWSGLPADARVQQLGLDTDLPASQQYVERIKTAMHEISDVPEGAMGKMQPISNTSGVALHTQFQPLVEKTEAKRATYGAGFAQINYLILRIAQTMGLINLPFDLCKSCGGRIVETVTDQMAWVWQPDPIDPVLGNYVQQPVRRKRCFHIDKQTLQFMDPQEMRLKFVREYGFGKEVREAPLWMIQREMKLGRPSFWDYAAEQLAAQQEHVDAVEAHQEEAHGVVRENALNPPQPPAQTDAAGNEIPGEIVQPQAPPPPPPPVKRVTTLPAEFIDVPEEPENVTAVIQLVNPYTGELVREVTQQAWLVPTGDQNPQYLNPFENEVKFHDALPKDDSLEAQLFQTYQQNNWVDPEWVREHVSLIAPDAAEISQRIGNRAQANPESPGGGYQEAAPPVETDELNPSQAGTGDVSPETAAQQAQFTQE